MQIIDLEGRPIKITDLEGAIAMVEEFLSYDIQDDIPSVQRFNDRRTEYWTDVYQKLLKLKNYPNNKTKSNGNDTE